MPTGADEPRMLQSRPSEGMDRKRWSPGRHGKLDNHRRERTHAYMEYQ